MRRIVKSRSACLRMTRARDVDVMDGTMGAISFQRDLDRWAMAGGVTVWGWLCPHGQSPTTLSIVSWSQIAVRGVSTTRCGSWKEGLPSWNGYRSVLNQWKRCPQEQALVTGKAVQRKSHHYSDEDASTNLAQEQDNFKQKLKQDGHMPKELYIVGALEGKLGTLVGKAGHRSGLKAYTAGLKAGGTRCLLGGTP